MAAVSIIVPVYNVEQFLRQCVGSILEQSFTDFELILINDGSTDASGAICEQYAEQDNRIRVFHTENAGQASARNYGVKNANADLVCFIDSDDVVNPYLLEAFINAYRNNDVGAVACDRISGITPPEAFFLPVEVKSELIEINEDQLLKLLHTNDTLYWTLFPCLIKKSICEANPLTPGRIMEDNAVTCKWLTASVRIIALRATLYFYRKNPNSTMNAAMNKKKLDYLWALEEQLSFYEGCGYQRMAGAVAKQYVEDSVWLARRVKTELNDEKLARSVIRKAVCIHKKYKRTGCFTAAEDRKLFKAAHPFLHRVKKKLHIR